MSPQNPSRFTPTDEWERKQLLEQFEAAQADPGSAAADVFRNALVHGAPEPPVPMRVWLSRWRWPLLAMTVALITAIACVAVGMLSPDENIDVYYFVAGFGGGVFGSTVVASVVFLVEMKRSEIRSIEQMHSDRFEVRLLERAIAERFASADGESNTELILAKMNSSAESLEETLAGLRTQLERIEGSLP